MTDVVVREYGSGTPPVVTLHGGPAAAGDVEPLARELAKRWHVLEPFQRGSGGRPLTVAVHVQDLDELIRERCAGVRPILVGHSWGAMLALAYGAEHPDTVAALVLVGCGTFSTSARAMFKTRLHARLTAEDLHALESIERTIADRDIRCAARGRLMARVYAHDMESCAAWSERVDAVAHEQTWADMMRLQENGTYPDRFAAIRTPTLMIHGDVDPHPGRVTSEDLRRFIPQLQYCELRDCGHYPWFERRARESFYDVLESWMTAVCRSEGS